MQYIVYFFKKVFLIYVCICIALFMAITLFMAIIKMEAAHSFSYLNVRLHFLDTALMGQSIFINIVNYPNDILCFNYGFMMIVFVIFCYLSNLLMFNSFKSFFNSHMYCIAGNCGIRYNIDTTCFTAVKLTQ